MQKKMCVLILTVALAVFQLTGCGTASSESDSTSESAVVDDSALPSGNVSLTVWGADEDEELINEIISSFISEYSSQATFNITFEAHSEANCKDDILTDVLNAPDVFTFADDQLMALVASGVLKEVSDSGTISSRNLTAASEAASVNGTLYAYPLTADNGYFLFYNTDYISAEDATTMDSLMAAAAKAGKKVFMDMCSGWYMYAFWGNTDMEIGLDDDGITTYCNWNAKYTEITGVDVAEAMIAIGTNEGFSATSTDGFAAGAADGTFVAGVSGIWDENSIKEAWGDSYAATKLPTYTVAGQQLQMASYAGYKLVGVNSYSDNAAWAAVFADWMTNEQNQTLRFNLRGQGPSNINASASGDVAESKAIQALQMQADYSSLQRVGGTFWTPAANFGSLMSQGNPGGKDLQVLLNEMVTEITGEESTGDLVSDDSEATEEVAEETTEEVTDEATDASSESSEEGDMETSDEASIEESTETEEITENEADTENSAEESASASDSASDNS